MQTAVEYFFNELQRMQYFIGNDMLEAYKQAKEMEKQQIIDAWFDGYGGSAHSEDEYYNETYGSKGSDVMTPENHIGVLSEAVKKETTSSQTEISDESWEGCDGCTEQDKYFWTKGYQAGYNRATPTEISDEEIEIAANNPVNDGYSFIEGAKWYREYNKKNN